MELEVCQLGRISYQEATALQEKLLSLRQEQKIGDLLLLLEHPPVITIGKRKETNHILKNTDWLEQHNVKIHYTNRGGDVTYHGPGQIVGYPIIDLNNHGRDIRKFVGNVEEVFIQLLRENYGIAAFHRSDYPGVWVEQGKITAIGFAIKRWVSMHGFAFNVNTDLEPFQWIVPCGITNENVCSLASILNRNIPLEAVSQQIKDAFADVFQYHPVVIAPDKLNQYLKEH